jgi:hypothetical protein
MRLLTIASIIALTVLPAMAQKCGNHGNSPENPTIILGLLGGLILMWRYAQSRSAKSS